MHSLRSTAFSCDQSAGTCICSSTLWQSHSSMPGCCIAETVDCLAFESKKSWSVGSAQILVNAERGHNVEGLPLRNRWHWSQSLQGRRRGKDHPRTERWMQWAIGLWRLTSVVVVHYAQQVTVTLHAKNHAQCDCVSTTSAVASSITTRDYSSNDIVQARCTSNNAAETILHCVVCTIRK